MELLIEIGCEELPASFQRPSVEWMRDRLAQELADARLWGGADCPPIATFATPRRLAVAVRGIAERAPDAKKVLLGPPLKTAYGADGKPTQAAVGFAKKAGVPVETLRPDGDRVAVVQDLKGQTAREALPGIVDRLVAQLPFRKAMRWGAESAPFARPVHWIAASLDGERVAARYADVTSGLASRGHRFHAPAEFPLPTADGYVAALRERHVLADWDERRGRVWAEVQRAAAESGSGAGSVAGAAAEPLPDDELLETVTGLVEEPHAVVGRFEAHFLELPPEVLVSEMRGHQKYFAVRDAATKKLLPAFVAVSNTLVADPAVSRRGYERVLRARLSDGRFFFDEDRKVPLEARLQRLDRIVFFQGLGTQGERSARLGKLALWLAKESGWGDPAELEQAARLCKADLTSGMVGEFPELQGIMGATYARLEGLPAPVCAALEQHYWPRTAEGPIPTGPDAALLALADRLDQLVGFFGVGKEPSGTSDPYALRRAAIGALRILLEAQRPGVAGEVERLRLDLRAAIGQAQAIFGAQAGAKVSQAPALLEKVWAFLVGRLEVLWKEQASPDAIAAALGTGGSDVVFLEKRLSALSHERRTFPERFAAAAGAFKRVGNILSQAEQKQLPRTSFRPELAQTDAERSLAHALERATAQVQAASEREELGSAWEELAALRPSVDGFFDGVMVMDPDPSIRDNRLALLRRAHELFSPLADFTRLQT